MNKINKNRTNPFGSLILVFSDPFVKTRDGNYSFFDTNINLACAFDPYINLAFHCYHILNNYVVIKVNFLHSTIKNWGWKCFRTTQNIFIVFLFFKLSVLSCIRVRNPGHARDFFMNWTSLWFLARECGDWSMPWNTQFTISAPWLLLWTQISTSYLS